MRRVVLLTAFLLALGAPTAQAQFAVIDASANVKALIAYGAQLKQWAEQVQQTKNQYDQITNQIRQIQYAYTSVEQGVRNLTTLRLNSAADLLNLNQVLLSKLNQAQYIGYQASQAATQAQSLYTFGAGLQNGTALRQLQAQWSGINRDAARVGITVQAMQQDALLRQARVTELLQAAATAPGALAVQQAQAQLQAQAIQQQTSIEQQLATMGRLQALQAMQADAEQQAMRTAAHQTHLDIDLQAYAPAGRWLGQPPTLVRSR